MVLVRRRGHGQPGVVGEQRHHTVDVGRERLTVISSTPLDASVLNRFAADLGEITIYISNVILGTSEKPMLEVSEDASNEKGPGALPAAPS